MIENAHCIHDLHVIKPGCMIKLIPDVNFSFNCPCLCVVYTLCTSTAEVLHAFPLYFYHCISTSSPSLSLLPVYSLICFNVCIFFSSFVFLIYVCIYTQCVCVCALRLCVSLLCIYVILSVCKFHLVNCLLCVLFFILL